MARVDFAAMRCSYKYMNSGTGKMRTGYFCNDQQYLEPGAIFPIEGWWREHKKDTRIFNGKPEFGTHGKLPMLVQV